MSAPPPPRGPPPGVPPASSSSSAATRQPPAPVARRTPPPPAARQPPPPAARAAAPAAPAAAAHASSSSSSASSASTHHAPGATQQHAVPASALAVPKEGEWLASVPQKSELIRPSRFIDAAKKGQNELLVEFWNDPEKAIEINKIDPIYQTALHWAARGGHVSTVKLLLGWGANPNFRDKTGETPLHKAAVGNYAACCSALLDAGASRDILNAQHKTAMDLTEDRNTRFALALQALVEEEDQPFEQDDDSSD